MNRFTQHKLASLISLDEIWRLASALFIAIFIIVFAAGVDSVDSVSQAEQIKNLEKAVRRGIAQCYAVEGVYPPGIGYLKEHYGIAYDESRFYIDYRPIGANIMPDVTILPLPKD